MNLLEITLKKVFGRERVTDQRSVENRLIRCYRIPRAEARELTRELERKAGNKLVVQNMKGRQRLWKMALFRRRWALSK